ncbi:ORF138 [Xestia c-nigrum granulovirus]|uniref:ORF138 n=1 Tax=Xestia c-nigrum granulosis virus TaxID=51677 RepID=Q9PYQ8_GVXN|nr:ORF138 [Xestia c-nigrum granulovirus]AAF05252.1 ORF138 [Xestia c-nigrum granulovirus]
MERILTLKTLIADNEDGVGCWTHKVAIMFRCCGKMYTVQEKEAYYCVLFAPQCSCNPTANDPSDEKAYDCYVQNVITDGHGRATLSCCYYSKHFSMTDNKYDKYDKYNVTPSDVVYLFPKKCHEKLLPVLQQIHDAGGTWVGAVSVHEHSNRPFSTGQVIFLTTPNAKCEDRDFCGDRPRGDLLNCNIHFDTTNVIQLRKKHSAELTLKPATIIEEKCGVLNKNKQITFEDFKRLFGDKRDVNVWARCDMNAQHFRNVLEDSSERDKVIKYIEHINGAGTELGTRFTNTYYGSRLLIYLLDLQDDPLINYYEREIYGKIKYIYKDDKDNKEIERWCVYDGDIHLFKTKGLFRIIQNVKFDAGYEWFVKNVFSLTPHLFNRSRIYYYCNKPNSTCIPKCEYGTSYSGYTGKHSEYVTKCQHDHYTVLFSDAIKKYAQDNGGVFEMESRSDQQFYNHRLVNLKKYEKLWRFFDLVNVYSFTEDEVNCYNNNKYERKSGCNYICDWHKVVKASKINCYYTLYNRYRVSPFTKFFDNVYDWFMQEEHWQPRPIFCGMEYSLLPKNFMSRYLRPHRANHRHELSKSDLYKADVITSMHQDNGELGWPASENQHVLKSERKRLLVGLQRRMKHKLYEPDSGTVKKIKKRFDTMCKDLNSK